MSHTLFSACKDKNIGFIEKSVIKPTEIPIKHASVNELTITCDMEYFF